MSTKITTDTAAKIAAQYTPPVDVAKGLEQSMGEELAASESYLKRAKHAVLKGDCETARIYEGLAKEENNHYEELNKRLFEISR